MTNTSQPRTWLITGVSSGFGQALARTVAEAGDTVIGTLRHPEQVAAFEQIVSGRTHGRILDVTQPDAIQAVVDAVVREFGRIDVLVNNAGFGMLGAIEETPDADARQLFDTNVFGLLKVLRAVLPHLRQQRAGHVLNLSSVGGLVSLVGSGIYCASKFAVEGLSEALRDEVAPFGIRVTLVEPGGFRTDFAGRSMHQAPAMDAYADTVGKRRAGMAAYDGKQPGDPAKAALAMLVAVNAPQPPFRLLLGSDAWARVHTKINDWTANLDDWKATTLSTDAAR